MPVKVVKHMHKTKPSWHIVEVAKPHKRKGHSFSEKNAKASARIRNEAHRKKGK